MEFLLYGFFQQTVKSQPVESNSISSRSDDYDNSNENNNDNINPNSSNDQTADSGIQHFVCAILIFITITIIVGKLTKKKNLNNEFGQKLKGLLATKYTDQLVSIQLLEEIKKKFELSETKLAFKFLSDEYQTKINNIKVYLNKDHLALIIKGQDEFGPWQKKGIVIVNQERKIQCMLQKVYNEQEQVQGDDILIYYGVFSQNEEKFAGYWQYVKEQSQSSWTMSFINK